MIPRATYRLQFNKGFGFDQAAALAPYLARLGSQPRLCFAVAQSPQGKHARL